MRMQIDVDCPHGCHLDYQETVRNVTPSGVGTQSIARFVCPFHGAFAVQATLVQLDRARRPVTA